jgi:hypothetical protein
VRKQGKGVQRRKAKQMSGFVEVLFILLRDRE